MSADQQQAKLRAIRDSAAARSQALERLRDDGRDLGAVGAALLELGMEREQATVQVAERLRRALGS